jgi:hypothetical protein
MLVFGTFCSNIKPRFGLMNCPIHNWPSGRVGFRRPSSKSQNVAVTETGRMLEQHGYRDASQENLVTLAAWGV